MKKIYQTIFFLFATSTFLQAQVTVFTPGALSDLAINGDYMYYVGPSSYVVQRTDISDPYGLITVLPVADSDESEYDSNSGISAIGVDGDYLYLSTIGPTIPETGYLYQVNLTNIALDAVKVENAYAFASRDIDFAAGEMYVADWYDQTTKLRSFDVSGALPVSSSIYINRDVTAFTINGFTMYLAESIYDGTLTDGEIFVKNMLSPASETFLIVANGLVRDLLMIDGLLYFTDLDGIKRFDPADLTPEAELIVANADYGDLTKMQHKAYTTGESCLFVLEQSGQRILKVDLNAIVTSIANEHQVHTGIYPNPAQNELTVTSNSALKSLTIYDMLGKPVKSIQLSGGIQSKRMDINTLATGMYVLEAQTEGSRTTDRFMKN